MKLFQKFLLFFSLFISCLFLSAIEKNNNGYEKSIVIVIPSYNNQEWCIRNLQSVLSQNYTNFRVVYTDDCSSDDTVKFVEEYLAQHDVDHKVSVIKNSVRRGA